AAWTSSLIEPQSRASAPSDFEKARLEYTNRGPASSCLTCTRPEVRSDERGANEVRSSSAAIASDDMTFDKDPKRSGWRGRDPSKIRKRPSLAAHTTNPDFVSLFILTYVLSQPSANDERRSFRC